MSVCDTLNKAESATDPGRATCTHVVPVILAGGSGTRLWPISRENSPKQLLGVVGSESLLQETAHRMEGFAAQWDVSKAPIVACGEEHRFVIEEQLTCNGCTPRLIIEPVRRDTAPALTLAAALACAEGDDAILVILPSDHLISDVPALQSALEIALRQAQGSAIVALGVPPRAPETGFGYIRVGRQLDEGARRIEGFVEKPAAEFAAQYVAAGSHWWNSGIFVVRASVWLEMLQALEPAIHGACVASFVQGKSDGRIFRPAEHLFAQSPADSIDYAVMERLSASAKWRDAGVVVPLDAGWSDLGSWDAVWAAQPKDERGNVGRGRVMFEGAVSCYAHSEGRLVACVGTNNLVVVETADAVLVADRSRVQDVKRLVTRIKAQNACEADSHRKVRRPWGFYDSIDHGERFQVKRIVVSPGAKLSLQLHHHRAEHWIVVAGTALVTRGDDTFLLGENQSAYIPVGTRHRLENPGKLPLELIEVQSGSYLGEDDIVRLEDRYGRA